MNNHNILVSIVIVSWNRKKDVIDTLSELSNQTYNNYEIVFVDNGSTDGTAELVEKKYENINIIKSNINTGGSGGRNLGIKNAKGDIIVFLDSDAVLKYDALEKIVRKFNIEDQLGVISFKSINFYTKKVSEIDWIYGDFDMIDQNKEFYCYSFTGCGFAVKKEIFNKIGLFWEKLFVYREEEEISLRIINSGFHIKFVPDIIIYHKSKIHGKKFSSKRLYYDFRNSIWIYFKWYPLKMAIKFSIIKTIAFIIKSMLNLSILSFIKAFYDTLKELPKILKERNPITINTWKIYKDLLRNHGPLRWRLIDWLKYNTPYKIRSY